MVCEIVTCYKEVRRDVEVGFSTVFAQRVGTA